MLSMESNTLFGIWTCSAGFHTDGLEYRRYVQARRYPMPIHDHATGERVWGRRGPCHEYWCTIHEEWVTFSAE